MHAAFSARVVRILASWMVSSVTLRTIQGEGRKMNPKDWHWKISYCNPSALSKRSLVSQAEISSDFASVSMRGESPTTNLSVSEGDVGANWEIGFAGSKMPATQRRLT